MRSKIDARLDRSLRRKKRKSPPGGKALQRLFFYAGQRDPALTRDILDTIAIAKTALPRSRRSERTLRAAIAPARGTARTRGTAPAARAFAAALTKAAAKLTPPGRQRRATRRRARTAVPPRARALLWQDLGPSLIPNGQTYGSNRVDVIGRVSSIAVDPSNPKHLLLGAAGGGIWESADTGATWQPRADQMPSLAIGAIAFDPTGPTTVYAGSGEGNFYSQRGAGLYKSIDGGTTWSVAASGPFVGLGFYQLVVDRQNPAVLYAATTGGFYKSTNSGISWSLKRGGPCWDVSVHPSGGSVELLATFTDGLFASANAGNAFTAVALPSAPASSWTRLAVDRVTAAPDTVYVFGAAGQSAYLWRRTGMVWTRVTSLPALNTNQAWYDWFVAAPPDNKNEVFVGAIATMRGNLAGTRWTWSNVVSHGGNSIHPDQHCLTFSPGDSKIIYAGNDGGIYRSANSGASWKALNKGLGITEIEYLASDPTTWKSLMAGTQDNGTLRTNGSTVWEHIADGDGGDCGVNQLNPNIVYHSYYNVSLERSTDKGSTWRSLNPPNLQSLFYPPVEVSGSTVAIAAASLVISRTGGPPWTTVSLGLAAGTLPSAMREVDANTMLIGTTSGGVLRVSWNGSNWSKAQLSSPAPRYISCIAVDPSNPRRYWVTFSQPGGGMVYRSEDSGASWVNCTAGLPNIPMNAIVVDPANFKRVWVAADVGVYQTLDLGSSWSAFANGLPNAMAADLLFHKQDRTLICGTRSRGAWAIPVT
jgi:hypothetical protein